MLLLLSATCGVISRDTYGIENSQEFISVTYSSVATKTIKNGNSDTKISFTYTNPKTQAKESSECTLNENTTFESIAGTTDSMKFYDGVIENTFVFEKCGSIGSWKATAGFSAFFLLLSILMIAMGFKKNQ